MKVSKYDCEHHKYVKEECKYCNGFEEKLLVQLEDKRELSFQFQQKDCNYCEGTGELIYEETLDAKDFFGREYRYTKETKETCPHCFGYKLQLKQIFKQKCTECKEKGSIYKYQLVKKWYRLKAYEYKVLVLCDKCLGEGFVETYNPEVFMIKNRSS